jgi:DNA-binding NarL/FixJ family response regulator
VSTSTTSARTRNTALTPRLAQVLPLIAAGLTDDEIAARLGVTCSSVRGFAFRLVEAYSATSRAHMIACAFRQGDLS